MNRTLRIMAGALVLIIVAGAAFYGGTVYGQGRAQAARVAGRGLTGGGAVNGFPGFNGAGGQGGQGQRGNGQGGALFGQIEQIGPDTLTITDANGKQTQVHVTDTTLIEKNATVAVTDLTPGETVIVSGAAAADGSITARSVQVAPANRFTGQPDATPQAQ